MTARHSPPLYRAVQLRSSLIALLLFATLFCGLTAAVGLVYMEWSSLYSALYFFCFEFLLIGIAYDITMSVLAIALPAHDLPASVPLTSRPKVAVLITLCDDAVQSVLERLGNQTYSNYQVFILDDSADPAQRSLVERFAGAYTVLRRESRRGHKAGNLNHWLDQYADQFPYFAILDSDSLIDDDFLEQMLAYAEHPENADVAIFQSKILTWNVHRRFSRLLGVLAPLRFYILERTTNRMGNIFSYGHNVLCRTACVQEVGGFHENLTAEDTVLSFLLDARGYRIKLVNVVSYDSEPEDVSRYIRRTVRWAKQTVELFRLPWHAASLFLKVTLCYNLYTYVRPAIYLFLLLFTAWTSLTGDFARSPDEAIAYVLAHQLYLQPWFIVLWLVMGVWLLPIALHFFIARRAGVRLRDVLITGIFSIALTHLTVVPVMVGMLRTALGAPVAFVPTNARKAYTRSLGSILRPMRIPFALGLVVLLSITLQNQFAVFGLNCLWIVLLIASPLILWLVSDRDYAGAT